MVTSIVNFALFVGIALGALLLVMVCMIYYKQKRFGVGGVLLSFFGVILLGLSIWSEVEFSFGRMKFHAIKEQITELAAEFDSTMAEISSLKADQDTLMIHVANVQNTTRLLFSNNVPAHVQNDITKIVERDSVIKSRFEKIEIRKDAVRSGLESLLNSRTRRGEHNEEK